jgi:uncharacterized membrane protein
VATWFVFPQSWISFGVLHGLALMVLLARLTAAWPIKLLMGMALAALAAPWVVQHPVFDNRWLNGVGLVTVKPVTEDYAPLLPWMGMVWLGVALGPGIERLGLHSNRFTAVLVRTSTCSISRSFGVCCWLGRGCGLERADPFGMRGPAATIAA